MNARALVVRRLLVDLEQPFRPDWNGRDAFRTGWFNALSMSFPLGEQFFIDSVRQGAKVLPEAERPRFEAELQGFVGQEASHRRIHALFNAHLVRQGHVNTWERRIAKRLKRLAELKDPRHAVAATAATEHFTAILAKHLLEHPQLLDGAEPRLQTLWFWHASEELEHRCTAFDLYRAMGGGERWRLQWMWLVTFHFTVDVLRQTARNLWHDKALLRWSTWRSGFEFLFGAHGVVRCTYKAWRAYFRADFHPSRHDAAKAIEWLRRHESDYTVVRR